MVNMSSAPEGEAGFASALSQLICKVLTQENKLDEILTELKEHTRILRLGEDC